MCWPIFGVQWLSHRFNVWNRNSQPMIAYAFGRSGTRSLESLQRAPLAARADPAHSPSQLLTS
jgi:hypothetical protein